MNLINIEIPVRNLRNFGARGLFNSFFRKIQIFINYTNIKLWNFANKFPESHVICQNLTLTSSDLQELWEIINMFLKIDNAVVRETLSGHPVSDVNSANKQIFRQVPYYLSHG